MAAPAIEHAWSYLQGFVEANGWRLLALGVAVYVLAQRYSAYATRAHVQRTLREANDPERVAVLRREAARVREQQQQRLQETLPTKKSAKPKKSQ